MTYKLIDATDNSVITSAATIRFSGANGNDIVNFSGIKKQTLTTSEGQFELTIDPNIVISESNPFEFADKTIFHYKKLNIDPMSKTIVFSDALTTEKAVELNDYCRGDLRSSYLGVQFLDCDVEEPNANLFLKAQINKMIAANILVPQIDEELCNYCGKCQEVCEYKALAIIKPLYRELLNAEKSGGIAASEKILHELVAKNGGRYDKFILSL